MDDEEGVRRSLCRVLSRVVAQVKAYPAVDECFESLTSTSFAPSSPTVVLVDMRLPGASGLELLTRARAAQLEMPIIFISGESSPPEAVAAMRGGAFDFLFKPVSYEQLMTTVTAALLKDSEIQRVAEQRRAFLLKLDRLTPRERELCTPIALDATIKEIASRFGISEATVKIHKARVLEKMGVKSISELALDLDRFSPKRS